MAWIGKRRTAVLFLTGIVMTACLGCGPDSADSPASIESYAANGDGNYIESYADRYAAFAKKHKGMSGRDVLIAVNLQMDRPNYEDAIILDDPEDVSALVSKHYGLPKEYKPKDLVRVDKKYGESGVMLRADCYRAFLSMAKDMKKEDMSLYIKSGYRVNSKRGAADSLWYAWPGYSEHQTGLAFDLRKKNVAYKTLSEYQFEKTREYGWLCKNAHKYGFILSYPKGKSAVTGYGFEPWHWRYVGADIAADMKDKEFETYQEYWATYLIQDKMQ